MASCRKSRRRQERRRSICREPWGPTTFIHSQHSEPLTVPFSEGIKEKGIREFTWKLSLPERDHEAWIGIGESRLRADDEPITVKGVIGASAGCVAGGDRSQHEEECKIRIPAQESHEIHFAIGHGARDGKRCTVTCRVIGHPNPLYDDYVDAGTSMNMSIGVQQMLKQPCVRECGRRRNISRQTRFSAN